MKHKVLDLKNDNSRPDPKCAYYGLSILNYAVTSNHIHLMVVDTDKHAIPKSIQLIAGRTGRDYNIRKKRKGAFWEDRYHATAVQDGHHLLRCLIYIDMNMVKDRGC